MSTEPATHTPRAQWKNVTAAVCGIFALALALRSGISSFGASLQDLVAAGAVSSDGAALLTSLPVCVFAVFGMYSGTIISKIGPARCALIASLISALGLLGRVLVPGQVVFFTGTMIMLVGVAVGNTTLPVAVKSWFPEKVQLITSVYGALVIAGSSVGAYGSGTMADAQTDWRVSLGCWAVFPLFALVPWIVVVRSDRRDRDNDRHVALRFRAVARVPEAWWLALLFGMTFAQAYAQLGWFPTMFFDEGLSHSDSASMLAILTVTGIPTMLLIPFLSRWVGRFVSLPVIFSVTTVVGWMGMLISPLSVPVLWAILIGVGSGSFAWASASIADHANSTEGSAALSSFSQGIGFLIAIVGPLGASLLHTWSGGWHAPCLLLVVIGGVIGVAGIVVDRRWNIEDYKVS